MREARLFDTVNGLRGLAAIVVLIYHSPLQRVFGAQLGFIAVDLFFALSGFVIAKSYEARLMSDLSLRDFFLIRLVRFYPLYVVGTIIGVLAALASSGHSNLLRPTTLFTAFLMLPSPQAGFPPNAAIYPLNDPSWSLYFEMIINVVYAATVRTWTLPRLLIVVGGALAVMGCTYLYNGTLFDDGGWDWRSMPFGFVRVTYSFALGVVIFKLYAKGIRAPTIPAAGVMVLFVCLLNAPGASGLFAAILVGIPIIIALAVATEPSARMSPIFRFGGAISFALYAIHKPLHALASALAHDAVIAPLAFELALLVISVGLAAVLDRFYDQPIRAWLNRQIFAPTVPATPIKCASPAAT